MTWFSRVSTQYYKPPLKCVRRGTSTGHWDWQEFNIMKGLSLIKIDPPD